MYDNGKHDSYLKATTTIVMSSDTMENEQHNIDKAACLANMFHFFLSAAKSCLYPFLALYLGHIGLSATQVGIVMGTQAIVSMISIPQWTSCAKFLNKKRLLLVFSVLILILSYLSLSVLPSGVNNMCSNELAKSLHNDTAAFSTQTTITDITTNISTSPNYTTPNVSYVSTEDDSHVTSTASIIEITDYIERSNNSLDHLTISPDYNISILTEKDIEEFEELGLSRSQLATMSTDDMIAYLQRTMEDEETPNGSMTPNQRHMGGNGMRPKRDVMYDYIDKLSKTVAEWQGESNSKQYHTFIYVLLLLVVSALFASPLEKLADDCWFEYLDVLDKLEKYGHHRAWGLVGSALTPAVVAFMVVRSECMLGDVVYHMVIHFYAFIMLLVIVFCLSCYYPISQYKKTPKKSHMFKGLRLLCGDSHAIALTMCMFVYGLVYSCLFNFLFWRMSDLDSSELPMGAAVAVAALSEVVLSAVYTSCGHCTKSLSQCGSVILAFVSLAARLLFYSFMFNPWLVIAGESFHGCSGMLLQLTMENYPDFRLSILAMDRSALTVLNAISQGLGYGVGCFLSGVLYDVFGFQLLYQGAAALCVLWCGVFLLIHMCCRKKERILYTKLLSSEDTDSGDAADSMYDEDWLDVALERNN